jgi:prepilin signal peptidase PulO-like enzyme (type II secretory pathway)
MYRFLPVIAHRKGFRVVEVPVRHLKEWGEAHFYGLGVYVRRFLDVVGVMFLTKFTHRPLRFFGSLGALILLVGLVILTIITVQWVLGAGLYNRPILLVGILFAVLGVQVIGFGLVGEIIIYSQARNLREYRVERIYE